MIQEELHDTLKSLASKRPVFHSEADFQHELALELVSRAYQVRLEVPKDISVNKETVKAEIDLLVSKDNIKTAIELKYIKKACTIEHHDELFELKGTWSTNLSRFDCLSDTRRIEALIEAGHAEAGYSIFLSNASDAWKKDNSRTNNMAKFFSIHEGCIIPSNTALDWFPCEPSKGSVSVKRRFPYTPIILLKERLVCWHDYSRFESVNETFRYLVL